MTNGAASNYLLLSNSSGDATWNPTTTLNIATGSGTTNYHPRWVSSNNISGTSSIYDDGNNVGIGTTVSTYKLQVSGTTSTTGFRLTTNPVNEYILVSDSSGNGSWTASRLTTNVITTTGSISTVATVSVPQGYTTIYEVYVTATCSSTIWGAWRREVVLTNFSGTANVVLTNSQLDKQSGLIPTNLSFTCSSSNLLVQVTGTSSQTVNWITKYQKII